MAQPIIVFEASHRCKLCAMISVDPSVKDRMERTRAFKTDGIPVNPLRKELGVHPPVWYNHIRKHHYPMGGRANSIEKRQGQVIQALQGQLIQKETDIRENYEGVWDDIINEGRKLINSGEMKVTSLMVMKASADKAAHMAKKQDRKLDIAKMMYAFASGHGGGDAADPTPET